MWKIAGLILAFLVFAIIGGRIAYQRGVKESIRQLFAQAQPHPNTHAVDLAALPEPVQRYFQKVLPEGMPPIQYVRLKHSGRFKMGLDKDWIPITGEQYYTTHPPQFLWQGKTTLFSAVDSDMQDRGSLRVHLFSLLPIVHATGSHVDQGELLRWLGESVWYPTNLIPRPGLHWEAIDAHSARLTYAHAGIEVAYTVYFNAKNEIERLETQRYMEAGRLEKWSGACEDYQEADGLLVPRRIQATWNLAGGDHTYADFVVEQIEFGVAEPF